MAGRNEKVVSLLQKAGKTVALAESCTGGKLAATLTDVPGSSAVFECGIVCYSSRIKEELLGISPELIASYGVVSKEVAVAMAERVRQLGSSDYGIGITGVAGPGPDGAHPEGDIYLALTDGKEVTVKHLMTGTENKREENRCTAVDAALQLLLTEVEEWEKNPCRN